jgi:hypothetical protein
VQGPTLDLTFFLQLLLFSFSLGFFSNGGYPGFLSVPLVVAGKEVYHPFLSYAMFKITLGHNLKG